MKKGETLLGLCDYDNKTIFIADSAKSEEKLATIVHESLHALDESLSERRVKALSTGIAKALWQLGYRKSEQ